MNFSVDTYLARRFDRALYNCWDLVREVWLDLTGQDIGCRTPDPPTPLAMRRRFDEQEREFERIPGPVSPCIVLMRRPRTTPHVGVFVRGKVLHIHEGGPRHEPLSVATRGFTDVGFYRCRA